MKIDEYTCIYNYISIPIIKVKINFVKISMFL